MIGTIARTTLLQAFSLVLSTIDRVVLAGLLLRHWGLSVFEDWSLLLAAAAILGLFDLGLYMAFGNSFMDAYQSGRMDLFRRRQAVALFINGSILLLAVLVLTTAIFAWHWNVRAGASHLPDWQGQLTLLLLGLVVIVQNFCGALAPIYRAKGLFTRSLTIDIGSNSLRLALLIASIVLGGGPLIAAGVQLAVVGTVALVVIPIDLHRTRGGAAFLPALPTWEEFFAIARVAPQFYLQRAIGIGLLNVPVLALAYVSEGAGTVALFILSRTLVNLVRQIINALSNSLAVELSLLFTNTADAGRVTLYLIRSARFVTVLSSAGFALILVLSDPFTRIWTGGRVEPNLWLVAALGSTLLVNAPYNTMDLFLNYTGQIKVPTLSRIVNAVAALLFGLALAPALGALGIALGLGLAEVVGVGGVFMRTTAQWAQKSVGSFALDLCRYSAAGLLPTLAAGIVMRGLVTSGPWQELAATFSVAGPLAAFSIFWFGWTAEDREKLMLKLRLAAPFGFAR